MNMKRSMMMAATAAMLSFVPYAYGDVSVIDIKCTPRSPWNGLVDVEYTVACDDPNADVYVNPVAYDGDRRLTMFPSSFTGDGATNAVKAGKHSMVWDAMKDFGAFSSANFQLKMYAGKRLSRYVVVDLASGASSDNYPIRLSHVGPDLSNDKCRTTELWLRLVPPGEFWMGSPDDELGRSSDEDLHHVTFTKPFYLGVFEVTHKQWEMVQGSNKSGSTEFMSATNSPVRPIDGQCWSQHRGYSIRGSANPNATTGFAGDSFVTKLRARTGNSGFDLPIESRWEYACRAGTMTALYNGKNIADTTTSEALAEIGGYYGNRYNNSSYSGTSVAIGTAPVGSFKPNALGLYDMLGNVWELCRDGAGNTYADRSNLHRLGFADVVDPKPFGSSDWSSLVMRGGCWCNGASECRSARRSISPHREYYSGEMYRIGFRICAEAEF